MKKRIFFLIATIVVMASGSAGRIGLVFGDSDSGFVFPQYSKKVSLDFKNADLKDVLKAFSKQISMNFLTEQDADAKGITVMLTDIPVEEALEKILSAYGLQYEYDASNNLFFVKKKPKDEPEVLVTRVYQLKFASVSGSAVAKEMAGTGNISGGLAGGGAGGGGGGASGSIAATLKGILKGKGSVDEDPRTNSLIIRDVQENFPNIERLLARLDVPVPTIVIEVEMLDVNKEATDKMGFNWTTGLTFAGGSRPLKVPYAGITPPGAVSQGIMDLTQVGAVATFLRGLSDTKSLARPRVMTSDNQTAIIRISTNEAIGETCTTPTGTTGGTTTCTAERAETGVVMKVTPQVSLLTDEITLIVEPKVIDASKTTPSRTGIPYHNPEERGAKSILKVKNGETIIMGGLLRSDDSTTKAKIPLLGDVPLLGNFFKYNEITNKDRELVIFITPRILASSDQDSPDQKKIAEGVLKGEQSVSDMKAKSILQEMDRISDK